MKKFFFILVICCLIASCAEKNNKGLHNKSILLLKELSDNLTLNLIFDEFEYIPLETTEQSLFGSINKLIIHDDNFYILDKANRKKILVFSKDGKFIRTIGNIGKGSGEYMNIEDFTINEELQNVVVLCYPSTIYVYDFNGQFISQKKLTSSAFLWNISNFKDGYICSSNHMSVINDKEAFLLFCFDPNFNLQNMLIDVLPNQVTMPPLISNPLLKYRDNIAYFDFFTSTLYINTDSTDYNAIQFDFEGKEVPIDLYTDPQEFFTKQRDYCFFLDAIFADDIFLSTFIAFGKQNVIIMDLRTNKKQVYKHEKWFPKLLFYEDKYFYSSMEPLWITKGHDLFDAEKITNYPIEANSNPIILKFKKKTSIEK